MRSYKNYEPVSFAVDLASKSDQLLKVFQEVNVNSKLQIFNDVLSSTLEVHAPVKSIRICSRPCPYVTSEIKKLMASRDELHRRFNQTRDTDVWQAYKESRNIVKTTLKNAEKDYVRDEVLAHKDNPGSLWKVINNSIPSKEKRTPLYSKDPAILANDFNEFFSSVGRRSAEAAAHIATVNNMDSTSSLEVSSHPLNELHHDDVTNVFTFTPVTCTEVQRVILSMPSNKSPGYDKISMRVIKDCLPVILGPLTDIINSSFITSTFPNAWKLAEVIPLLKEGDHEEPSNNRPLSLLVVASKICERIALQQFSSYLHRHSCLNSHQSGNKKHHSTETLNISVSDALLDAMDKKKLSALILLDLSKAFDSLSHSILLQKLASIGASHNAIDWFKSYLSGRKQAVRIGSSTSTYLNITHGVPQGAILSPLLFCIYLNDLPSVSKTCSIESYVDDSKVLLSFPIKEAANAQRNLEKDLQLIAAWCCKNQLLINAKKTKFLLVGTRQLLNRLPEELTLSFLGQVITPVSSAKDLGVTFDSNLTYDCHINELTSSCMSKLCQINRVKDSFDYHTLQMIISALVMSKLYYCSSVWSNTSIGNIKKLQGVQNFACRIITNTRKFDHITPALKELGWLPIKEHLLYRDSIMSFKCMNGLVPTYLSDMFCRRNTIHNLNTRNNDALQIPMCKTKSGQRSFRYRVVDIWNNLRPEFKQLTSLKAFKKELKKDILNKSY